MNKRQQKLHEVQDHIVIIDQVDSVPLSVCDGGFKLTAIAARENGILVECAALHLGLNEQLGRTSSVPVRIHSACLTGEAFGSDRCDCRWQLDHALALIRARGVGIVVYLPNHEGCGSGLIAKLRKFRECDSAFRRHTGVSVSPIPSDTRSYRLAVTALRALGITKIELITNNPLKMASAEAGGMSVVARIPSVMSPAPAHILRYLELKRTLLGHLITETKHEH
jgi:GTP cyclohydrolase II